MVEAHLDVVAAGAEHPPHGAHAVGVELREQRIAERFVIGAELRHGLVIVSTECR
ncbi:MAG: hypothetical protein M3456_02080 [Actinomycetota bacterium]|nr:hypothetical protein [Actinomycetota bacterium]